MSLRRIVPLLLVAAGACARSVGHEPAPGFVDSAVFDPSTGAIPLPNDLALLPASVAAQPDGAQKELLEAFQVQGGFPNDIEVPITIDFTRTAVSSGATSAPTLDLTTVRPPGPPGSPPATVVLLKLTALGATPAAYDPGAITQTQSGAKTTLHLRAPQVNGSRNWDAGAHYAVAVRGGPDGVKTADGQQIHASPTMFLLLAGRNLADPANQALLPDPSLGAQLEALRQNYLPVFMIVDSIFPSRELAVVQTFQIAPARTHVVIDAAAGVVPLPSNFLLDYTQSPPKVVHNPAFGPAADGLATLDGFSTTAMLLATTSADVDPATVKNDSVLLFRVRNGAAERVWEVADHVASGCSASRPAGFVAQPTPPLPNPSPVIGLQPAATVPLPGGLCGGALTLPPLAESSDYVVVITNRVKDANGVALGRTTPESLLLFSSPLEVGGVPTVPGLDAPTAGLLEILRQQISPALAALPSGLTKADVATAYSVTTQSITPTAVQLAQLPYAAAAPVGTVTAATFATPAQAAADYGVQDVLLPAPAVAEVDDVTFVTLDLLDPGNQGAFDPTRPTPKPITAVVAVPPAAAVTGACPAGIATAKCAPLVVFRHGITRARGDMLFLAASLTSKGFVVASIDLAKHGDRTFCSADNQCVPGDTCVPNPALGTPVDAVAPGTCQVALLRHRMDCDTIPTCLTAPKGLPFASGNYLVSLNLFRTRDTLRQDIVDTTMLALALARPVALRTPGAPLDAFASHLDAAGIAVDPTKVYLVGQSLGANEGVLSAAANPRFSRAVFAEGGATAIDIFANPASTAFHPELVALLGTATPPIVENTPEYLQFLQIAKWVLDPADPANFAATIAGDAAHPRLPIGLPFAPAGATDVLLQAALCDDHVPNPQNAFLAGLVGFPPPDPAAAGTGNFQWFMTGATGAACPANAATHGVLIDFASPTLTGKAQATLADFLSTAAAQPTPLRP